MIPPDVPAALDALAAFIESAPTAAQTAQVFDAEPPTTMQRIHARAALARVQAHVARLTEIRDANSNRLTALTTAPSIEEIIVALKSVSPVMRADRHSQFIVPNWREMAEKVRALLQSPTAAPETCWLIERAIGGVPVWLAWRDRDAISWTPNAHEADRYEWWMPASRDAQLLGATLGIACQAIEHLFPAAAPEGRDG